MTRIGTRKSSSLAGQSQEAPSSQETPPIVSRKRAADHTETTPTRVIRRKLTTTNDPQDETPTDNNNTTNAVNANVVANNTATDPLQEQTSNSSSMSPVPQYVRLAIATGEDDPAGYVVVELDAEQKPCAKYVATQNPWELGLSAVFLVHPMQTKCHDAKKPQEPAATATTTPEKTGTPTPEDHSNKNGEHNHVDAATKNDPAADPDNASTEDDTTNHQHHTAPEGTTTNNHPAAETQSNHSTPVSKAPEPATAEQNGANLVTSKTLLFGIQNMATKLFLGRDIATNTVSATVHELFARNCLDHAVFSVCASKQGSWFIFSQNGRILSCANGQVGWMATATEEVTATEKFELEIVSPEEVRSFTQQNGAESQPTASDSPTTEKAVANGGKGCAVM